MDTVIKQLFTEKFRPKNLEQLIAPSRIKKELSKGLIQNLLLYGSHGTGKTSALFIIAEPHTSLYINASSERGIDIAREKISKFCSTISLDSGKESLKCVILDELDGATEEFYRALRSIMERYANQARFIASCNHIQKIPEPIEHSRFHGISFDPINEEEEKYLLEEYKKRIGIILTKVADISYTEEILNKFVKNDFPDMRRLMNKCQSLYLREIKELTADNFNINFDFKDLFDLCIQKPDKPYENYKIIINQYGSRIDDSLVALGTDFPEYLKNKYPEKINKLPLILIAIAEYQYQKQFVIDPLITLCACVMKIQTILNS